MRTIQAEKYFIICLLITLGIKCALAALLPLTGDEAYFILWGQHLDYGYYDHPPMVGWMLYLLLSIGNSPFIVRLPAVLLSTVIGIIIYLLLRREDKLRALLAATIWLLLPLNIINVLITTDTPLILFSFLSGVFVYLALQHDRVSYYYPAGIFLGMAFMSKYLSLLLMLAYFIYFIFRRKHGIKPILILTAMVLPFVLINLYWNYNHCWDNILFNFFNRHKQASLSPTNFLVYIVMLVYLLPPPLLIYLIKCRQKIFSKGDERPAIQLFTWLSFIPLLILALVSTTKMIGLHWVLGIYPFIIFILFRSLETDQLKKSIRFLLWFSSIHLLLIVILTALPLNIWSKNSKYPSLVLGVKAEEISHQLLQFKNDFKLATASYSNSAVLSHYSGEHFIVFGKGSSYARQDDILTDFRKLEGTNILVLSKRRIKAEWHAEYFASAEIRELVQDGATFYLTLGQKFNYQKYRENILRKKIKDRYYNIPEQLPYCDCYFLERYFNPDIQEQ